MSFTGAAGFLVISGMGALLSPLHARPVLLRSAITLLFVVSVLTLVVGLLLIIPGTAVHKQRGYRLYLWSDDTPPETRPALIIWTTLVLSVCNLLGFATVDWSSGSPGMVLLLFLLIMTAGYVVLWFYWRGQNWARLLVLLTSVDALLNLLALRHGATRLVSGVRIAEALVATFLLYWLNTAEARRFFARSTEWPSQ